MEADNVRYFVNWARWAKALKENAGWQCECCGSTRKLESHHIIPYHLCPDESSYDIHNGVCLFHKCHMYVHNGSTAAFPRFGEDSKIPTRYKNNEDFKRLFSFMRAIVKERFPEVYYGAKETESDKQ